MCSSCESFASRVPLIGGLSWGGCVNDVVLVFVEVSGFPEEVPATLVVDSVLVLVHALTVYTHLKAKPKLGYQTPDCVEVGGLNNQEFMLQCTEDWHCDLGFQGLKFFGNNCLGVFLGPHWKVFHQGTLSKHAVVKAFGSRPGGEKRVKMA